MNLLKKVYRLVRYAQERRIFFSDVAIRKRQNQILRQNYSADTKRLVVFIVPSLDRNTLKERIAGGTISIVSFCEETERLGQGTALLCTLDDSFLLLKHQLFENHSNVFRFQQLANYFKSPEEVIIHVPEYLVSYFRTILKKNIFGGKPRLQINIMNQNIRLMPPTTEISELKKMADVLTMTTAHQNYCTPAHRNRYGIPLHKLSTWVSPENYTFKTWAEKEDLIVVSPDPHPRSEEVLQALRSVQGLKVQIIQNLTYGQYKETISRAKWALTFGEGLDGYFVEPVLSGAVAFAVYNQDFFTPDFAVFPTVYQSMDALIESIANDINSMNNEQDFELYQKKQFDLCAFYYSREEYLKNIIAFYKKNYTYA